MDFTAYITLCLILVAPSCHSTREGRAARTAWTPVAARKDAAYLALVKTDDKTCAGSIPSASTVLTYCPSATEESEAYAGMTAVAEAIPTAKGNVQFREVDSVQKYSNTDLKICVLKDKWTLDNHVAVVPLYSNENSGRSPQDCSVLGFREVSATNNTIVAQVSKQTIGSAKCVPKRDVEHLLYSQVTADTELLKEKDLGGPAVTTKGELLAINMKGETIEDAGKQAFCNTYINVAKYREWIEEQKNGESGASGGTGGNSTSPSSGYSIHSYLNKYSNWKVLGFLVPTIVTFLQY